MKWEAEKWRKLYRRVDATWLKLPVLARGLGSELLKYAEDDGRIAARADEDTAEAVCCLLGARRPEWKAIAACVDALLKDGFIVRETDAILIRNFVKAQSRSSSAERQARYRESHRRGAADQGGDVTDDSTSDTTSDQNSNVTVTVTSNGHSDGTVTQRSDGSRSSSLSSDSEISGSLSADPQKEVPETARPRDSEPRAKNGHQVDLFGGEDPGRKRKRRGVETPIPGDWAPEARHFELGRERGLSVEDVQREARTFRSDALARDKRYVRWGQAFDTWLERANPPRGSHAHRDSPAHPNPARAPFAPIAPDEQRWTPEVE